MLSVCSSIMKFLTDQSAIINDMNVMNTRFEFGLSRFQRVVQRGNFES